MLNIGDVFPNFSARTTAGVIQFHDWLNKSWCILFSVPHIFGSTELKELAEMMPELMERDIKPLGLVCDDVQECINNIPNTSGGRFSFPIIADSDRRLSILFSILDYGQLDSNRIPVSGRAVFFIDPEAKLRWHMLYPSTVKLNLLEIFRAMETVQQADRDKAEVEQRAKMNPAPTAMPGMSTGAQNMSVLYKDLPRFEYLKKP